MATVLKCNIGDCKRTFTRKQALAVHQLRGHTSVKPDDKSTLKRELATNQRLKQELDRVRELYAASQLELNVAHGKLYGDSSATDHDDRTGLIALVEALRRQLSEARRGLIPVEWIDDIKYQFHQAANEVVENMVTAIEGSVKQESGVLEQIRVLLNEREK